MGRSNCWLMPLCGEIFLISGAAHALRLIIAEDKGDYLTRLFYIQDDTTLEVGWFLACGGLYILLVHRTHGGQIRIK